MGDGKFCKDCKHQIGNLITGWTCQAGEGDLSLVYGTTSYPACSAMRQDVAECGPKGRFFEPK